MSDPAYNSSDSEDDDPDLSTSLDCEMYTPIQWGLLTYSILVLLLYMSFQKRVAWKPKMLHGYFGLAIPINFIHENKDRWAYAAVFGTLSGTFLQLIFDSSIVHSTGYGDSILRGFFLFLIMLLIPLLFFALVGSVHASIQVLSHAVGFIYTLSTLIQQILVGVRCSDAASDVTPRFYRHSQYAHVFGTLVPILCCTLVAALYFLFRGTQALINIIKNKPFAYQQDISHHLGYVKAVLTKKSEDSEHPQDDKQLLSCIDQYIYKRDPYFKYPVRVICVASVIIIGLLVLTFQLINFFATAVQFADESMDEDSTAIDVVIVLANILAVIIPIIAYVTVIISFVASLATYRDHCKRMWKGDYTFLSHQKRDPAETLVRSTYYIGWQIGMAIWAWVFYIILMLLTIMIIVVVVVLMVFIDEVREWLIRRAIILLSTFVTGLLFRFLQLFVARYVFADGDSTFANNSRLFHTYAYFFLFYNALVGLGRALRRVFTSAVVSLFFLPRLDRSLLTNGLDRFDKGYTAYLSAVRVDATYNNPVMNVFVYLLSTASDRKAKKKPSSGWGRFIVQNYYPPPQIHSTAPSRARNMWHLAYTLLHNPHLKEKRIRREKQDLKTTVSELTTEQYLFTAVDNSIRDSVNNKSKMEVLVLDETNSS